MRRLLLGLSLASLLLGGAPALTSGRAQSQDDQPIPLDGSSWNGTITIEYRANSRWTPNTGTGSHEAEHYRTITFTLDRVPRYGDVDQWSREEVPFVMSGSAHDLEIIPPEPDSNFKGARTEMSDTISGSGTAEVTLTPQGKDEEQPTKMRLTLRPNSDRQHVTTKRHWVTTTGDGTRIWDETLAGNAAGPYAFVVPYDPDQGFLSGNKVDHNPYRVEFPANKTGIVKTAYRYDLALNGPSDTEAVLETPAGYKTWWPKADKSEDKAGPSPLLIKVRLHKKGEPNKPAPHKAQFKFELVETSKEKGVCLNWPPEDTAKTPTYDLRIEQDKNDDLKVTDGKAGQLADSKEEHLSEGLIVISVFDWGAYGKLKVTAILDDGKKTRVEAHLDSDRSKYELEIPKDEDDNYIADDWEDSNGVTGQQEDDDTESDPEGDGHVGDGLTLYEEYRGFMEDGEHIFGDPKKKDLFICNKLGQMAELGISMLESISGLAVHSKLRPGGRSGPAELDASRVINRNHTRMAHTVNQHGLFVDEGDEGFASEALPLSGFEETPGPPKKFAKVRIGLGIVGQRYSAYKRAAIVAHEILHCCSVYHHGEIDRRTRKFQTKTDAAGVKRIFVHDVDAAGNAVEPGTAIVLFREAGGTINPDQPLLLAGITAWVGCKQGQHSGDTECVMRYSVAWTFVNIAGQYVGFSGKEVIGLSLCTTGQGTGVNEPGRQPEPRYGNAMERKGNCPKQICVNDKYH